MPSHTTHAHKADIDDTHRHKQTQSVSICLFCFYLVQAQEVVSEGVLITVGQLQRHQ